MKKQLLTIFLVIAGIMLVQPVQAELLPPINITNGPTDPDFWNINNNLTVAGSAIPSSPGLVLDILKLHNSPLESGTGELTAGQIYSKMAAAGLTASSLQSWGLVFGFALNETGTPGTNPAIITEWTMKIYGSSPGLGTQVYSIGNQPITVVGPTQGASGAEARFQLNLGFNFMEIFNANSTNLIQLSASVGTVDDPKGTGLGTDDGFELFFFDAGFTANPPLYPPPQPPDVYPPGDGTNPSGGTAPVPEPATMLLLGSGLIGLAGFGRKKLFK